MNWRALLTGGVFLALLIAAVLIARPDGQPVDEAPKAARPAVAPVTVTVDPPLSPLTRADLIDAAGRAADAHARGVAIPSENLQLAGRRFTLRLPFGCSGPAEADDEASMRWSYDPAEETLRVWVTPKVWTDAAPVRAAADGIDYEAAEGFWIRRPWLRSGDCPVSAKVAADADPVAATDGNEVEAPTTAEEDRGAATEDAGVEPTPVRETLALLELFEPGSRRAARRNGRPYAVVMSVAPGEIDLSQGLRVVVSGRLSPWQPGSPIACSSTRSDERPLCLIRAEIDRVAITDHSGQRVLGEWGN